MNILKNLEAVVIAAVALTFVTAVATAATAPAPVVKAAQVVKAAPVAAAVDANVATVVVTGKRLTAQQKMTSHG